MRGIAEEMDGAMQQAPQPSRHFMVKQDSVEQDGADALG